MTACEPGTYLLVQQVVQRAHVDPLKHQADPQVISRHAHRHQLQQVGVEQLAMRSRCSHSSQYFHRSYSRLLEPCWSNDIELWIHRIAVLLKSNPTYTHELLYLTR